MISCVNDSAVEIREMDSDYVAWKAQNAIFSNVLPTLHSRVSVRRRTIHGNKLGRCGYNSSRGAKLEFVPRSHGTRQTAAMLGDALQH
jgi:hypothetical protein